MRQELTELVMFLNTKRTLICQSRKYWVLASSPRLFVIQGLCLMKLRSTINL